jgi:DNA-3-methyladenine glycosylase II
MKPQYWNQACTELSANDEIMANIIASYKGEGIASRGDAFETLLRSIVGQQISVKAAQSVWNKLLLTIKTPTPEAVVKARKPQLRKAGLSERKAEYAKDLAKHFIDKRLNPKEWHHLSDEDIILRLIDVRGIGRWSAEMFLMFHLLRPNIFPKADLGLQKAISKAYKKKYPMSDRQLEIFRKRFDPWNSVATWYLWRSLDPIPVEY